MAPEPVTDAFSDSEEEFFHSVPPPDDAATSERPVTLDQELFVAEAAPSSEREARRARFIRPVAVTLGVLGALTLVGLARRATLTELNQRALAQTAPPSLLHAASPSEASPSDVSARDGTATAAIISRSAVRLPQQIAVETANEDPPELFMSTADDKALLDSPTSQPAEAASVGNKVPLQGANPAPQVLPSSPKVVPAEARRARHVSLASTGPVSKSALLSAIRASRPAHASAQKTR